MTNIAELGFRVNTADLDKASSKLDMLKKVASGVTTTSEKMAGTVEASAASMARSNHQAAISEYARAEAILKRTRNGQSSTRADIAAAVATKNAAKEALNHAKNEELRAERLMRSAAAQKGLGMAFRTSSVAMGAQSRLGPSLATNNAPSTPRDMMPNRFNTGNLAAQFQDIGVTAAMGMNPMLIAMQQGTQLSAILNSMQNPLKGLAVAFGQVFNAVSLGTIAIVALVAGMVQMVNWTSVAKSVLNGLADAAEVATPYILALAAGLALLYSGAIINGIITVIGAIASLGVAALYAGAAMLKAWLLALSPLQLVILGVIAVIAAFEAFGVSAIGIIKKVVSTVIGAFTGAFDAIKAVWGMLPAVMGDLIIQTANVILGGLEKMVNGSVEMINKLVRATGGTEIVFKADLQLDNEYAGKASQAGKVAAAAFNEAMSKDYGGETIDGMVDGVKGLGATIAGKLRGFASGIGVDKDKKGSQKKDPWEELQGDATRRLATMKAEQAAIGMTAKAAAKLKYQTELLNDAQQKKIDLDTLDIATGKTKRQVIEEISEGLANQEIATNRTREAFDFGKDAAKGFFQDMKQGLQEGKGLWESFGNAVTNVLNKILDKIAESGIDMIYDSLFPKGGAGIGAGGGILSDIGEFLFSAKGNAFNSSGVQTFAKGGAFTNSVVNSATPFTFANGGAFGVMGEAGPEAVLPLHRGPDGSLGVKSANDNGSDTIVAVNVHNYGNSKATVEQRQTSQGLEIDVIIDQMTAENISRHGSESNRALNTYNNRQMISR